ncbi:MAG: iron-containing alcohol dehydrogenase [Anaerolineae bacterium]|nr:iron-containing alcohol dehydrogenase [Anaerolineae bacterium]
MNFEFATATRICFGTGKSAEIGTIAAPFGTQAVLIGNPERSREIIATLQAHNIMVTVFAPEGEPTINFVSECVSVIRDAEADMVIGCGGGSALDLAKAAAVLAVHEGEVLDYLEVIGQGKTLTKPSIPVITVPTTAGTGSEVTANAVVSAPEQQLKVSLRSPHMLPRAAIIDPALTLMLPERMTVFTGMDALTQVIEPFVSLKANPITDALCSEGITRAGMSLQNAVEQPDDLEARADMALAALLSGMALANAKLGAVHGFAGVIGGMTNAPHGAICAALLSPVMKANLKALSDREPQSRAIDRYQEIAIMLTGDPDAIPEDGAVWVAHLVNILSVPGLAELGVHTAAIPEIVRRAASASSMQGNPIKLTEDELAAVLENAL